MVDPFLTEARQARVHKAAGVVLLVAVISVAALVAGRMTVTGGTPIDALVLGFGGYASEAGEMPIVVVQLPDGSRREVAARRNAIEGCQRGSRIVLVQDGDALGVSPSGCRRT